MFRSDEGQTKRIKTWYEEKGRKRDTHMICIIRNNVISLVVYNVLTSFFVSCGVLGGDAD